MEYRRLGRTGLSVSEIGYGAWGIGGAGWVGADEEESVRALHRAIERGVTFIDTARGYGDSERIVGQVVRDHPDAQLHVATKVPPLIDESATVGHCHRTGGPPSPGTAGSATSICPPDQVPRATTR